MITKGERAELRSLVRNQFKVLRAEVEQRGVELQAQLVQELNERYAAWDKEWSDAIFLCNEKAMEANRAINDILREMITQPDDRSEFMLIRFMTPNKPDRRRHEYLQAGNARIAADMRAARLRLDRDEADLLTTLSVGALESTEARAFLERIPKVGELVSAARLAELEAQLGGPEEGGSWRS